MKQIRVGQNASVSVDVRRTARAKRLSLRVSSLDGKVTLTVPKHVSLKVAQAFAEEKSDWIAKAVSQSVSAEQVQIGTKLPVEGQMRTVLESSGRTAKLHEHHIEVPVRRPAYAVQALLKGIARDRLVAASEEFSKALGKSFNRITLRDTRSRWGSCTADSNLMYSWRLVMAPPDILRYVAAHEVAHLKHMDHSPAFWAAVEQLYPDYAVRRQWLRREGVHLHRYRFGDDD